MNTETITPPATIDLLMRGMKCLVNTLGIIDAEYFISAVRRERFDYTKWQREYFDNIDLETFVSEFKTISDMMENESILYHFSPPKTVGLDSYVLPRITKKPDQRVMMLSKFWNDAEAMVLPQIFNDRYLKLDQFEKVDYWQNINEPEKIDVIPAIIDTNDLTKQTAGAEVQLSYVLGILFDRDAIMVDFHLEDVSTTAKEARKHYRTVWNTINKNPLWDPCENIIIFILAD